MKKQYFKLKEDGGFVVETNNGNINADGTQIVIKGDFTISAKDVSYLIALLNNKENIINKNMYSFFNEGYNGYRVVTLDDSKLDKFMKQTITNICQKEEIIKRNLYGRFNVDLTPSLIFKPFIYRPPMSLYFSYGA